MLEPGHFWSAVRRRSRRALETGALQPISTHAHRVTDRGVDFVVRLSDNLARKQQAPTTYGRSHGPNPFLPPDPALTVGDLPPEHVAVLNKFNVLADHVLVVTRRFEHQEAPLTRDDFTAVAPGLSDGTGLAFYNAGRTAGASQAHKHFQLVPLPLGTHMDIPTAMLLEGADSGIDTVAALGFRHAFHRLDADPVDAAVFGRACHQIYLSALSGLGIAGQRRLDEDDRLPPYNLLLTERWLLVVPRRSEHYGEISINGLGYAGSLFVSTPERLEQVRAAGPMAILATVSTPMT